MRDLVVTLAILGAVPFILIRPHFGVLMWIWVSIMNPHRLTWGFAYDFPFAQVIAIATLFGIVLRGRRPRIPWSPPIVLLFLFMAWMNITTVYALAPQEAYVQWLKVMKTMLMTFLIVVAIEEERHIKWVVWVAVLSVAFYGVKGGIFTLLTSGAHRVFGPPGSDLEDNNDLALGLLMTIPLLWYLQRSFTNRWARLAFLATIALCVIAALGTYSRGAVIAAIAMIGFALAKGGIRIRFVLPLLVAVAFAVGFMPDHWFERMDSITAYSDDKSSLGRINAWHMAFNLALDRPLIGAGFQPFQPHLFELYAPDPSLVLAAHSIYFSALAEHGFIGLALFLSVIAASWITASWITRRSTTLVKTQWTQDLATAIQASLVAYMVGGAFLSMLYFDVAYYLIAVLVLVREHVAKTLAAREVQTYAARAGLPLTP